MMIIIQILKVKPAQIIMTIPQDVGASLIQTNL